MDTKFSDSSISNLHDLYRSNDLARQFFDRVGNRQNNLHSTSVDSIVRDFNASRPEAMDFFKKLHQMGYGKFVIGRKGGKSRIVWSYNLLRLGEVARGISLSIDAEEKLSQLPDPQDLDADSFPRNSRSIFTIQMAKERLAESLGISPEQIEITIRA